MTSTLLGAMAALGPDPRALLVDLHGFALLGIIGLVFVETGLLLGFVLPGDSLLFTAGLMSATPGNGQPHLNLIALLVGCTAAAVLGDQVGYTIGTRGGTRLAQHGDGRLFRRRHVERTQAFFARHGAKTIVLARFVPVVRTFAPVLAGVGGMRRRTFTLFNVIGAVLWVWGVTLLGYFLGTTLGASVDSYLLPIVAFVVVISVLPPLIDWRRSAARVKSAESEDE